MAEYNGGLTKDAEVMLGNPKRALIAMAVPVMIANLVQSINNVIDTVWLTAIGIEAQAAVNVIFPLFFVMIGFGNGIAVGTSQALARRIGAMDRRGANAVASQAVMMTLVISIVLATVFTLMADRLILMSGGASNLEACMAYAIPIFLSIPSILLGGLFGGLLRSEGAAKRSMAIHVVAAVMNIVLDPIFIFVLDMGLTGAAIATAVSMTIPLAVSIYWYFLRMSTFVRIPLGGFRFDRSIDWDILRVGIPASMEVILMAMVILAMDVIIEGISPIEGVAIYGNGWKLIDLFFMPALALGFAIVPICAAALGARDTQKIGEVYVLALKYGILICIGITLILILFGQYLVVPFSYSEGTESIRGQMAYFVAVCAAFMPFTPLGYTSVGYFQAMGWGYKALLITATVNLSRIPVCLFLAATVGTLDAVWWGIVASEIGGSTIGGLYGMYSVRRLIRGGYPQLLSEESFVKDRFLRPSLRTVSRS
jgi:putative MATE family efflux protein